MIGNVLINVWNTIQIAMCKFNVRQTDRQSRRQLLKHLATLYTVHSAAADRPTPHDGIARSINGEQYTSIIKTELLYKFVNKRHTPQWGQPLKAN